MNELADAIATGCAQSYPEYRELVGKVQGLAAAEREILDLVDRLNRANGDEETIEA